MKNLIFILTFLSSLWLYGQTDKNNISRLVERFEQIEDRYSPDSTFNWNREYFWLSVSQLESRAEELKELLGELQALDDDQLQRQDQINKSILTIRVQNEISEVVYKEYLMPFNAEGGFYNQGSFSVRNRSFLSSEDFDDYLSWLQSYMNYLRFNIGLLNAGIEQNVMRPKVIVTNTIMLLEPWLSKVDDHPFYQPFKDLPTNLSPEDKEMIDRKGRAVIAEQVIPTYQRLKDYFASTYMKASPSKEGIANIHNGKTYYEDRVRFFTTLDISPDSVFDLGRSEVQRIKELMEGVIAKEKFQGGFTDFVEFLRTDEQFYASSPEELLSRAAWLSKKAEGELPRLFGQLYELPFTVEPVPDAIAPTYTGGRYVPGSRRGNRPGIYWVNTYDLPSRPFYTLPSLTLHEAVPGHHLQIMLAAELDELPGFRRNYYISAYGEGWGLYAEYLGEEMHMYETPYELFGRYTYEMWRACRLVVDVGLHYQGWSREKAVSFLANNTALSLHEVNTEIDRYIGWPGQALSYKMGEITIKKLRKRAERQLGDDFDIQEFHRCILKNGSVPLSILGQEVEAYIEEALND